MTTYLGFPSRAAYLEDLRQWWLRDAEALEHGLGADSPRVKYAKDNAARLLDEIAEEKAKEAK